MGDERNFSRDVVVIFHHSEEVLGIIDKVQGGTPAAAFIFIPTIIRSTTKCV
jgi:hypothetical protein